MFRERMKQYIGPFIEVGLSLLIGLFLLGGLAAASDYTLGDDGYYWKDGYPYERYEGTCWKTERKWYYRGCCEKYYKDVQVAYPCHKYRRVVIADPETGLERVAGQMLGIVKENASAERKLRRDHAFVNNVRALGDALGVTDIRLPQAQTLYYGDLPAQFPAQTGSTQYGTYTNQTSFYGNQPLSLQPAVVDVKEMLAMDYELEKFKEQNQAAYNIKRKELNTELGGMSMLQAGAVAERQEGRAMMDTLGAILIQAIRETKPGNAGVSTTVESFPVESQPAIGAQGYGDRPSGGAEWFAGAIRQCAGCHEDHMAVKTKEFRQGIDFSKFGQFNSDQLDRVALAVASGRMPKGKPFPQEQRKLFTNYLLFKE